MQSNQNKPEYIAGQNILENIVNQSLCLFEIIKSKASTVQPVAGKLDLHQWLLKAFRLSRSQYCAMCDVICSHVILQAAFALLACSVPVWRVTF